MEITITILTGPHRNQQFSFQNSGKIIAGRASDCQLKFLGNNRDRLISRHHCELEIDPPHVWIRDLGSRNGTYVNCRKLNPDRGEYVDGLTPRTDQAKTLLEDRDIISVGGSTWQIQITEEEEEVFAMDEELMEFSI